MRMHLIIPVIILVLVVLGGCTQSPGPVPTTPATTLPVTASIPSSTAPATALPTTGTVSDNTIRISGYQFDPATITIRAGSTVRWVNGDPVPHRIQFDDTHFSPILLGSSQSGSQKFDEPGVFPYICSIHPEMHGTVIVQ